jgi:hypothetical protein
VNVVHVGASTCGLTAGVNDETPWENRVRESADRDGETLVTIGPLPPAEAESILERLVQVAGAVECEATLVHTQEQSSKAGGEVLRTTYTLIRKRPRAGHHLDLRCAVVGNVDAGKSTLVGVLTGPVSFLDDGRGLARSRVLRHKVRARDYRPSFSASPTEWEKRLTPRTVRPTARFSQHEAETGRTSSIAEDQHMRLNTKGASLATERHQKAPADSAETAKVVSFIDLAGHERYLRTSTVARTRTLAFDAPLKDIAFASLWCVHRRYCGPPGDGARRR